MKLIAQGGSKKPTEDGCWFGLEVFESSDGKTFYAVIHTSRYDGIKRTDHYATPKVPLNATDAESATVEADKHLRAYVRAVRGEDAA